MGTLQKRPNGNWTGKIRRHGYPAQSRTFLTKKDAQRWITETEAEISRDCFVDTTLARKMILREAFARYAEEVSTPKRGAADERIRLAAMQRDPLADYSFAALKASVIAAWRDRRLRAVSGSTVNRELTILRHVIEVARKEWDVALRKNPVDDVRRPRSNPPRERRLPADEQTVLMTECHRARSWWLASMVELALQTGMRQSEIRTLQWENVNWTDHTALLPAAATKTLTTRTVPLDTKCMSVLEALHRKQGVPKRGPVFPGVTRNAVKLAFRRARKRAGLSDFRFHDTRHEATSRLTELGLNPVEVAAITGHKTLSMLHRYTHLRARELVKKLG
ncbi:MULTISPECIES: site-specific integrase [unclassified Caballeronia]|uniref:tyrosine-type recombinase/integrase n=1 Tax=unclassified Caballeronia TaxID=2646786 RepID=UPI001F3164BA|nr:MULTISPECIES: site-specific integrase [unclassified Caballeronia]MCE4542118.1 site-specific integrase [Caballeronia sp. PC1]MCE4568836.1 site-specific integrase [Caballeronia sp. CLC5]